MIQFKFPPQMNDHFKWQADQFDDFKIHIPFLTISLSFLLAAAQIMQLLALFLPLKIMIIIGSDTIPRFMTGYISLETRNLWLIWLTIGTVVFYMLTILIEVYTKHLIVKHKIKIIKAFKQSFVDVENSLYMCGQVFLLFCQSYANATVFTLAAIVFMVLKPYLGLAMLLVVVFQVLLTLYILRAGKNEVVLWLRKMLMRHTGEYVKYISTINFLLIFLLLLIEYIIIGTVNSIFSILCLLIARRMSNSMSRLSDKVLKLEVIRLPKETSS